MSHTDYYHIIDAITPTVAAGQFVVDLRGPLSRPFIAAVPFTWRHFIGGDGATEQPPSCNRDDDARPQKSKNYVTFQISIHLPVAIKQNCILRRRAKLIATCHSQRNKETHTKKENCTLNELMMMNKGCGSAFFVDPSSHLLRCAGATPKIAPRQGTS